MSSYPGIFTTPLQGPVLPKPVTREATPADIQILYNHDVTLASTSDWSPLHYCHCGKLTHLVGTSSTIPVLPMWENNNLCIFHSPMRHVPIVSFE